MPSGGVAVFSGYYRKITTLKKSLQVLQNDYKHTGNDDNYKIDLFISSLSKSTCTELNS
jgi:hypothetical protein